MLLSEDLLFLLCAVFDAKDVKISSSQPLVVNDLPDILEKVNLTSVDQNNQP